MKFSIDLDLTFYVNQQGEIELLAWVNGEEGETHKVVGKLEDMLHPLMSDVNLSWHQDDILPYGIAAESILSFGNRLNKNVQRKIKQLEKRK